MKKTQKVLIVEDNALCLRLFSSILRAKGFEVLEDPVGDRALDMAIHDQPDLILMDIMLPHQSGLEIAKRLKNNDKTNTIPVIAMTALTDAHTQQEMIKAGCHLCLTKPFSMDVFLKTIHTIMSRSSMSLETASSERSVSPEITAEAMRLF